MADEKPTEPDYKKYEAITDILAKDVQNGIFGLEDTLTRAWAEHTKGTPSDKNQGDGLADKLYSAADDYIRKQFYSGETPKSERATRLLNDNIQSMIGFTGEHLSEFFKGKKEVHIAEVAPIIKKSKELFGEEYQKDMSRALKQLKEADFEPFRDYILKLAKGIGLEVKKDSMPRLSEAVKVYAEDIFPEYMEFLKAKERREAKEKEKQKSS